MIKNVIWDFDGTLFDTYPAIAGVFLETLRSWNIDEHRSEILRFLHQSLSETYDHFSKKHSLDREIFRKKFRETEEAMDVSKAAPFAGTQEVLENVIENGGFNFIYTNRGISTYGFLKEVDFIKYFKEIITSDDGFGRKPSPDCINYLVEKHSLLKSETLMIGDREIDVLAAVNAEIPGCYFNSHQIPISIKPDIYIDALPDLIKFL